MKTCNVVRWTLRSMMLVGAALGTPALAADKACARRTAGLGGPTGGLGQLGNDGSCKSTKVVAEGAESQSVSEGLTASAQCRDLSFSYSRRKECACASHGGILEWLEQQ